MLLTTLVTFDRSSVLQTFDARVASFTHDIQDFIGFNIAPWDFDWKDTTLHRGQRPRGQGRRGRQGPAGRVRARRRHVRGREGRGRAAAALGRVCRALIKNR